VLIGKDEVWSLVAWLQAHGLILVTAFTPAFVRRLVLEIRY